MNEELKQEEKLVHYVMFWLKPGLTEAELNGFTGFFEQLKTIGSLNSFSYGKAAKTEQRDVVNNTFTYAMFAGFNTMADHEQYQADPVHLKAIEDYSKYWEKVVVHDTRIIV